MEVDGSKFKTITVFVLIGFIMTIGMAFLTIVFPDSTGQLHVIDNPANIISDIRTNAEHRNISLFSIILDNFFILGYFALFYGAYLLTKNLDPIIPKASFAIGVFTAIFDILENALLIGIFNGIPVNYTPDNLIFGILWFFVSVKDIFSVLATFSFAIMFLLTLNTPKNLRIQKMVLAGFLLLYAVLGALGLMSALFLELRNLSFVIDMAVASAVFYSISRN
ncbi:MAG: hypothetical protein ACW98A_01315 [Candidatus Hodarchaeales archaeon]|jgi:hypothetical protein